MEELEQESKVTNEKMNKMKQLLVKSKKELAELKGKVRKHNVKTGLSFLSVVDILVLLGAHSRKVTSLGSACSWKIATES